MVYRTDGEAGYFIVGANDVVRLSPRGHHTNERCGWLTGLLPCCKQTEVRDELKPVEKVWQFICDNWLSNRIFKSYDDIVDHCRFAWSNLVSQPLRIM